MSTRNECSHSNTHPHLPVQKGWLSAAETEDAAARVTTRRSTRQHADVVGENRCAARPAPTDSRLDCVNMVLVTQMVGSSGEPVLYVSFLLCGDWSFCQVCLAY